jgi:hypothetical protein
MKRLKLSALLFVCSIAILSSCKKDTATASTDSLYVPTTADVTATATLAELQQGRTLYMNSCGACHGLYSPDNFTSSGWTSVLSSMLPRTGLSTSDGALLKKYVTRGK